MTAALPGVFNVQQFTDTGAPAVGYRLYTYNAGTTTHKPAYTDPAAAVPHTYVSDGIGGLYIQLDARGELPAPLFLTSGAYDLCLKTPAGATVWSRRAFAASLQSAAAYNGDKVTATAGQTVVTFSAVSYTPGTNSLAVYLNGLRLNAGDDYAETSINSITMVSPLSAGDEVVVVAGRTLNDGVGAESVSYIPAPSTATARNARDKLREARKSVEDFGGAADGVTNNDAAIALAAAATGGRFHFPGPGTYVCGSSVWGHAFTAGDNVTLKVSGTDYVVSNAIAGPWRLTVDSSVLMSMRHAVTGNIVQSWQNGASGTATYFYRGLSVQTDSHSMQMGPATNGGSCDLLWQRSAANTDPAGNRFNVTFEEATDRLLLSFATTASGAPAFDSAMQVYAGTSPQLLFPGIAAQFNGGVGVKQRAAGGIEVRLTPTSSTVADIKQIGGSGTTYLSMADAALGFFGASPVAKPTVSGSRGGNVALANLLTALANLGLITNSTTA